jgi:uncharacterized protein YndB with AHSA1/START domain
MGDMPELTLAVDVDATPQQTFDALVDWDRQGEWMLGTKVSGTAQNGRGVGGGIKAFTGAGPIGFWDTMEITAWDEPWRVDVLHTGKIVKGTGSFVVEPVGAGRSRFIWREELVLPLGTLGRLGWPLVKPGFAAGVRLSLHRFARWVPTR